jgi:hypothetical protein
MEKLRQKYLDRVAKDGHALTLKELRAEKEASEIEREDLPLARRSRAELAQHERLTRIRPKRHMTHTVPHFGCVQIDLAQFRPELAQFNGGHRYFVMAVEMLSGLWAVAPAKNKTTESFMEAIKAIFQLSPIHSVRVVLSDRESALHSARFVERLRTELGISAQFLQVKNKAYAAELALRWMKVRLTRAMIAKGTRCWTALIDPIVRSHNVERVPGTRYRRVDVNNNSWEEVAAQKLEADARRGGGGPIEDVTTAFNTGTTSESQIPGEAWKKKLFKFRVGDRVLLSRRSDYREGNKTFPKPSVEGAFGSDTYTVVGAYLRNTRTLEKVSVYKIRSDHSQRTIPGYYYDNELLRLPKKSTAEAEEAATEEPEAAGPAAAPAASEPAAQADVEPPRLPQPPTPEEAEPAAAAAGGSDSAAADSSSVPSPPAAEVEAASPEAHRQLRRAPKQRSGLAPPNNNNNNSDNDNSNGGLSLAASRPRRSNAGTRRLWPGEN